VNGARAVGSEIVALGVEFEDVVFGLQGEIVVAKTVGPAAAAGMLPNSSARMVSTAAAIPREVPVTAWGTGFDFHPRCRVVEVGREWDMMCSVFVIVIKWGAGRGNGRVNC
jgi:hypothetical protein